MGDASFAWDHRGSRGELPAHELAHVQQQLRSMERPANPAMPAYDLGAVARSFYSAIATGTPMMTTSSRRPERKTIQLLVLSRPTRVDPMYAPRPPGARMDPRAESARFTLTAPATGEAGAADAGAADAGSAVRAIHPGRVVFSDWLRGSGLLVVVDHGDGYLSLYANNQTLIKNMGDWVNRGEALATAGDNGGLDQPGIYFEIRRHGEALDPAVWCES